MRIGIPTEIKNHEYRVAITPAGVAELTKRGHDVIIEAGAGLGSAIDDADFKGAPPHACRTWTMPRVTSTSAARRPHTSLTRSPANAPSRIVGRRWSGIASWSAHTCSVVGAYGR